METFGVEGSIREFRQIIRASGVASACHHASPPVPFLLIKGICDFADEHKSDGWQPYAADAAAAFAAVLIKRMAAMPALPDLAAA